MNKTILKGCPSLEYSEKKRAFICLSKDTKVFCCSKCNDCKIKYIYEKCLSQKNYSPLANIIINTLEPQELERTKSNE